MPVILEDRLRKVAADHLEFAAKMKDAEAYDEAILLNEAADSLSSKEEKTE